MSTWTVYILKCKDDSLYTGITTDLEARIEAHNRGDGAKYTRGRGPVRLVWSQDALSESQARKREYEIKQLSRAQKLELISAS